MPVPTETKGRRYPTKDLVFLQEVVRPLYGGNDQPPTPPTEDNNHDNGGRRGRDHSRLPTAIVVLGSPTVIALATLLVEALTSIAR